MKVKTLNELIAQIQRRYKRKLNLLSIVKNLL